MKPKAYIIHPYETYGNPEENRALENAFVNYLQLVNPRIEYVRPFKLLDENLPREIALIKGMELLSKCEIAIAAPNWYQSEGCKAEVDFALENGIPVRDFNFGQIQPTLENTEMMIHGTVVKTEEIKNE